MPTNRLRVAFDAVDPARVATFWAGVLGRQVVGDDGGALVAGTGTQLGLRFVPGRDEKVGPNRLHLHLTSVDLADQQRTVAMALGLGAGHVDVGQRPEDGHVVLADPEGNELCVMEPGNAFLAGCGFLGEVACDGTPEAGRFWSEALGWPVVWDQDQEVAVQSPEGGTKIGWGGALVTPLEARDRQRLELAVAGGDLHAELDRLASLGACRLATAADGTVVLADPDGIPFDVRGR